MIQVHKSAERLTTRPDWLESRHAFSFGAHFDPGRVTTGPPPDDSVLEAGDAVSLEDETALEISAIEAAEILLFDLTG